MFIRENFITAISWGFIFLFPHNTFEIHVLSGKPAGHEILDLSLLTLSVHMGSPQLFFFFILISYSNVCFVVNAKHISKEQIQFGGFKNDFKAAVRCV